MKRHQLRIDMTPMVDLGFLLISFFVITTELTHTKGMPLIMPTDAAKNPDELGESYAFTVLLDHSTLWYYEKDFTQAQASGSIHAVTLKGLREAIIRKQKKLDNTALYPEGRKGMMLLIKPGPESRYETLVNVLDEATINVVDKYAIIAISREELDWLQLNVIAKE